MKDKKKKNRVVEARIQLKCFRISLKMKLSIVKQQRKYDMYLTSGEFK